MRRLRLRMGRCKGGQVEEAGEGRGGCERFRAHTPKLRRRGEGWEMPRRSRLRSEERRPMRGSGGGGLKAEAQERGVGEGLERQGERGWGGVGGP